MSYLYNLKLRTTIGMLFFVGFFMPTIIACFMTIRYQRQVLTAELDDENARTIQMLALGLKESVWTLVPEEGEPLVDAVMSDSRIQRVLVNSERGNFILRTRKIPDANARIKTMRSSILSIRSFDIKYF